MLAALARITLIAFLTFGLCMEGANAQVVPAGFTRTVLATGGPSTATAMARRPDGSVLIAIKEGTVRVYRNGALLATPFHTFASVSTSGEAGVIGIAIDPDYANNGYVYVRVSRTTGGGIMRLTSAGDVSVAGSETVLFPLTVTGVIHQGGAVHFGPDGKLYFTIGETGLGSNAPLLTNLFGKIMRINSDGTIPTDNPFYTTATDSNRAIWAKGLRNPYTFAFQRGTGRLHINHVGGTWEEVNVGVPGADYGWPSTEGMFNQATFPNFTLPLYTYQTAPGAAITGGTFYNPETATRFPAFYRGAYFFGDIVRQTLRTLDPATGVPTDFGTAFSGIVDLDVTPEGRLLVLSRNTNLLASIDYTLGACCNGTGCTNGTVAACAGDFRGVGSACTAVTCCNVNFNHDDVVSVQDIFDYLAAWFAGLPSAEFDGQAGVQVTDIFAFLASWFAGCP